MSDIIDELKVKRHSSQSEWQAWFESLSPDEQDEVRAYLKDFFAITEHVWDWVKDAMQEVMVNWTCSSDHITQYEGGIWDAISRRRNDVQSLKDEMHQQGSKGVGYLIPDCAMNELIEAARKAPEGQPLSEFMREMGFVPIAGEISSVEKVLEWMNTMNAETPSEPVTEEQGKNDEASQSA